MRFVIADDSLVFQAKIAQFLRHGGHEVVATVATGEDAVAACECHRPDGVVLDWCMGGGLQGGPAAQEILAAGTARVIVMATSVGIKSVIDHLREAGVSFIRKPFHREQLLDAICQAVQRANERSAARA